MLALLVVGLVAACSDDGAQAAAEPGSDSGGGGDAAVLGDAPSPILEAGAETGTDAGPKPGDFFSGTRLRANLLVGDGARLFDSFRDTTLGTDCRFAFAEDQNLRCIPLGRRSPPDQFYGGLYSEATCTEPLLEVAPGCAEVPKYLATGEACGQRVYPVAAKLTVVPTVYRKFGSVCGVSSAGGNDVYAVGAKLDPTALVRATASVIPRAAGLAIRRLVAEDGAEQTTEIVDTARNAACAPGLVTGRCAPNYVANLFNEHSDNTCTTRVGQTLDVDLLCGGGPSAVTENGREECGGPKYSAIGAVHTGPRYHLSQSQCTTQYFGPPPRAFTAFAVGAPIATTTFPGLKTADEGGGALLKLRATTATTNERLMPESFYDVVHKSACSRGFDESGAVRCLPPPKAQAFIYSDDQCTQLVYAHDVPTCAMAAVPPPALFFVDEDKTACGEPKRSFGSLGPKVDPVKTYVKSNATCFESTPRLVDYYSVVRIPSGDLVTLTRTTE